ncbi:hypothetical protein KCW02_12820, partial [Staphylococcus aureus]|nr:hypothetical protein [Staphylococcus aureus]
NIGGAPTQRISKRNSTNNASWGAGPQHREIGFPISTDNGSWGGTVGRRNKFCENIISIPLPRTIT